MHTLTTHGIKISVESFYQPSHSEPLRQRFLHVYNIRIENKNPYSVKLLTRHWVIRESTGVEKIVEGDGVIGKQPILDPGGFHQYSSYCILASDHGKMEGRYHMERLDTDDRFDVHIPGFILIVPTKLN